MAHALVLHVERRDAAGRYRGSSSSIRAGAALLAALIASGFVHLLLRGSPGTRDDAVPRTASIVVLLPREPPPRLSPLLAEPPPAATPASKAVTASSSTRRAAPTTSERQAPSVPAVEPSSAESPVTAAAAPAPLDLSDRVMRSAIAQSKGAVRQQAEAAGQEIDTPRPSRDQVFAAAAAEAGAPGCLRPDALKHDPPKIGPVPLAGIFAAPFVVHAAITGKCKP